MPARHMAVNDAPATFAGYRLGRQLSIDTVSTTYRATSQRRSGSASPVVIRISHPLRTADDMPDAVTASAFVSTLTAAVAVTHPALVPIVDAGDVGDRVYVVTRPTAGPTLDQYLRDQGPLGVAAAVALLRPIAEGLDIAHTAGVVHGAISPHTILVHQRAGAASAVLTGFGIENLLARQVRQDRTAIDLSDVAYVAPEQLEGGAIDGRTDQYAMACALYHCVVGRPPFVRDSVAALFGAHLFSDAFVPVERGDPALAYALDTGMAKRPQDRHASCATLMTAAVRAAAASPAAAASSASPESPDPDGARSATGAPATSPLGQRVAAADVERDLPVRRQRRTRSSSGPPVRIRASQPTPSLSEQAAARRIQNQIRRRLPIPWPVAAMLVLAGIICTLALAAVLRERSADDGTSGVGPQVSGGVAVANPDEPSRLAPVVPASVQWARRVGRAPIDALATPAGAVVVASENAVTALGADDGVRRWSRPVMGGAVTDLVASGDVVGLRASGVRVLASSDGTLRWSQRDALAPLGNLTADDAVFYGIRHAPVTPELVAFDAATGQRMWHFDGNDDALRGDVTVAAGRTRVAVLTDDRLIGIDPPTRGEVSADWTVDLIAPWVRSLAVGRDVAVVAGHDGRLCAYALDDGDQTWCADVVGMTENEPTVVIDDGAVVVAMPSHVALFTLRSGALRYTLGVQDLLPVAVTQGDQVVVAEASGTVHGIDVVRGYEAWQASGLGEVTALAGDAQAAYVGTADGDIVRIRPARGTARAG